MLQLVRLSSHDDESSSEEKGRKLGRYETFEHFRKYNPYLLSHKI